MRFARHGRPGRTRVPPGEIDHPAAAARSGGGRAPRALPRSVRPARSRRRGRRSAGPLIAQPSSVIHRRSLAEKAAHAGPAERVLGDHPEEPGRQPPRRSPARSSASRAASTARHEASAAAPAISALYRFHTAARAPASQNGEHDCSHTVDRLLADRHDVRVLDTFATRRRENLLEVRGNVELIEGDIRSYVRVSNAVAGMRGRAPSDCPSPAR